MDQDTSKPVVDPGILERAKVMLGFMERGRDIQGLADELIFMAVRSGAPATKEQLAKIINPETINDLTAAAMVEMYSIDTIEAAITFYSSPAGMEIVQTRTPLALKVNEKLVDKLIMEIDSIPKQEQTHAGSTGLPVGLEAILFTIGAGRSRGQDH